MLISGADPPGCVFDLSNDDRRLASAIDLIPGRLVGAALVHGDLLGNTVSLHGFVKKRRAAALSRLAVRRKTTVLPSLSTARQRYFRGAFDLDVRFIHAPTPAPRALMLAEHFL